MRITASAKRHGVPDADILHALANPLRDYTSQGDHAVTMIIGPARDGLVLEVGVVFDDEPRAIHAMPARRKYWP
jgi:hypothetical protein